ncbi:50S ribosomal protein L10 [Microgenomates group bacterium RIFCSPLOWO2_01_FULL_46_13]|nr:MAG: 50S ribosomal protein L10 [Microgenomates group bacterium RIFCSPHIGHO2_01_FULL_45_11]OGV94218.1 MAG: 50S ribosomal protein L10 [Microgenomates group bacterium RIFCSPLOWO2_01_FULL_46_13]
MPSQKNIDQLARLKDKFSLAKSVVLADYSGLSVADQRKLRQAVVDKGGEFTVAKNNLIKLAAADQFSGDLPNELKQVLDGPTALLIGLKDEVSALKELVSFSQEHEEKPALKLGLMEGAVLTVEQLKQLASLPGFEELVAKLIGQLKAPTTGLVNVLSGTMRGLVQVLKAYQKKQAVVSSA